MRRWTPPCTLLALIFGACSGGSTEADPVGERRDEVTCSIDNGGCDPPVSCVESEEGVECGECPSGYTAGEAGGCLDVDECQHDNGGCDPMRECENTPGAFWCGPCPEGYDQFENGCVPAGSCPPHSLAAGYNNSCAIWPDGSLKCWGQNGQGQLGLGDNDDRGNESDESGASLSDINLGTGLVAIDVAVGHQHACAAFADGRVKCWGSGAALGLGTNDRIDQPDEFGDALPFVDLGEGAFVVAIDAGWDFTCALLREGEVKCWGSNRFGRLGLGDEMSRGSRPDDMGDALPSVDLGRDARAVQLSVGEGHACARLESGELKCWGSNSYGQLGSGRREADGAEPDDMGDALEPVDLGRRRTAIWVSAGTASTCAVLDDHTVKCWGDWVDWGAELNHGYENMGDALPAVDLGTDARALEVFVGYSHACATLEDGTLKCWGSSGRLANGTTRSTTSAEDMGDNLPAADLGTGATATEIAIGGGASCAILTNGTLKCWGESNRGQGASGDRGMVGDEPHEIGEGLPVVDLAYGRAPVAVGLFETHSARP